MPAFDVDRAIEIEAPPDVVYQTFSDFGTWTSWSPWLLAEPDAHVEVSQHPSEVGGRYGWDGQVVGAGQMEHVELVPPTSGQRGEIRDRLTFTRPWKSVSQVRFALTPARHGQATNVRWMMNGDLPWYLFWMKAMMQTLVGMDYDRGLKMVKELIETGSVASTSEVVGIESTPRRRVIGVSGRTKMANVGEAMQASMARAQEDLHRSGLQADGPWLSAYEKLNLKTGELNYTTGVIVSDDAQPPPEMRMLVLPATEAMHVRHTGRYEHLGNAWYTANQVIPSRKRKADRKAVAFELYGDVSPDTPEAMRVTDVYVPVR